MQGAGSWGAAVQWVQFQFYKMEKFEELVAQHLTVLNTTQLYT